MASFNNHHFQQPLPNFNQNLVQNNNYNFNSSGRGPSVQPFQRFTAPNFTPIPSPEIFNVGHFINTPPPNFSNPMFQNNFLNRPPVQLTSTNASFRPRFGDCVSSKPWNQQLQFSQNPEPFHQRPHFGGNISHLSAPQLRPSSIVPSSSSFFPRQPVDPSHEQTHFKHRPSQPKQQWKTNTRDFKRLKDDNAEKSFSCDTCDRSFSSYGEYEEHVSQHIKCNLGECTFEAHPKIVAIHKKMQHETGYASVINKLKDDAEIQKWREERRRRFPTAENVKKRQAEQEEKETRGEVLETKDFGKFKKPKTADVNDESRNGKRRFRNHNGRRFRDRRNNHFRSHPIFKPLVLNVSSDSDSDSDSHISLKKFPGLLSLTVPKNAISEPSNENVELGLSSIDESAVYVQSQSNKSNSLINYDSSINIKDTTDCNQNIDNLDDPLKASAIASENDELIETATGQDSNDEPPTVMPIVKSLANDIVDLNDEPPTALPITKSTVQEDLEVAENPNKEHLPSSDKAGIQRGSYQKRMHNKVQQNDQNNQSQNPVFNAPKNTLLEKLLADDIRHERNVVLQCIHHIVKKNFFGIGAYK